MWRANLFVLLLVALLVYSCTATRVVSTEATSVRHGDTVTTIVTKTIERYDARKQVFQ